MTSPQYYIARVYGGHVKYTPKIRLSTSLRLLGMEETEINKIDRTETYILEDRIRELYLLKCKQLHPDLHKDTEEEFKQFQKLYDRIKYLMKSHHAKTYDDSMNYATSSL